MKKKELKSSQDLNAGHLPRTYMGSDIGEEDICTPTICRRSSILRLYLFLAFTLHAKYCVLQSVNWCQLLCTYC